MNENFLASNLIDQVDKVAAEKNVSVIVSVTLRVGVLSGVNLAAMEDSIPAVAADSSLKDVKWVLEPEPLTIRCNQCGSTTSPDIPYFVCHNCSSKNVKIIGGEDLFISEMEAI